MRFDPKSGEERLLNEAVRRSRTPSAASPFSGGSKGAFIAPPASTTVPIEDGDGQYADGHDAMTDVDVTDDDAALTV